MTFSIRRAIGQAFEFVSARFGAMLAVAVMSLALTWLVMGTFMGGMVGAMLSDPVAGERMMMNSYAAGATSGAQLLLVYALNFAISMTGYAAVCALCSDRAEHTIGTALGAGVRAMPGLVGAWFLLGIGMFIVGLAMMLTLSGIIAAGQSLWLNVVAVIAAFGVFAWLFAKASLILPVAVIDEVRNPFAMIGRSWALTSGASFKIFVLFVAVMIVMGLAVMAIFMSMIGMPQPGQMPSFGSLGAMVVGMVVLSLAAQIFLIALTAAIHRQLAGTSNEAVVGAFS